MAANVSEEPKRLGFVWLKILILRDKAGSEWLEPKPGWAAVPSLRAI
jgi:hypothetical protein